MFKSPNQTEELNAKRCAIRFLSRSRRRPPGLYCGSLLGTFITAYVLKSREPRCEPFKKKDVAKRAFGDVTHAGKILSKMCSPRTDGHLHGRNLKYVLDAVRGLLRERLIASGDKHAEKKFAEFEHDVCQKLKLPTGRPVGPSDFWRSGGFEGAMTAEDFGLPDIMAWQDGSFGFFERLSDSQGQSIEALPYVFQRIEQASSAAERLELFNAILSISALNHPGSSWHEEVLGEAYRAAELINLRGLALDYVSDVDLQRRAAALWVDLQSLSFLPTLESPANAMHATLEGKALSNSVWIGLGCDVDSTLQASMRFLAVDLKSDRSRLVRVAYLSQKARLLAATGNAANLSEADQLHNQALEDAERTGYAPRFLFPIQRMVQQSQFSRAVRECERAVRELEVNHNEPAADAFAALLFHITSLRGGSGTADRRVRDRALRAVHCASTRYQYSHVFDVKCVRKLLGPGRLPRRVLRTGPMSPPDES